MTAESATPEAACPIVFLLADAGVYERLGPALRYLLVGLIDEPVDAVLVGPMPRRRALLEGTMELMPFEPPRWPFRGLALRALVERLRERADRPRSDAPRIVHALDAARPADAVRIAEALGAELILSVNDRQTAGRSALHNAARRAAAVTVPSEPLRAELLRAAVPCDQIELIRPGVPAGDAVAAFRDSQRVPAFITAGPLDRDAGLETLLRAFARLRIDRKDILLFLVGKGPAEPALRRLIVELGVTEAVTFTGRLEPWSAAIQGADVFCRPGREDAFSVATVQALAAGLAVVGAADTVHDCLRPEETAWLYPTGDEAGLETTMCRALTRPDEARAVAARGQAHARQHHSVASMVERFSRLYQRVALSARTLAIQAGR